MTTLQNKNQAIFNQMVQTILAQFTASNEPFVAIEMPVPQVLLSPGVQFLVDQLHCEELVSTIGHALLYEKTRASNGHEHDRLTWKYTVEEGEGFRHGSVSAFIQDNQSFSDSPLYEQGVMNAGFVSLDFVEIYSIHHVIDPSAYILYLPWETNEKGGVNVTKTSDF